MKSTIAIYDKLKKNSLNQWRKQLKKVTIKKNRKIISRTLVNEKNISKDISNSYLDKFYLKLLKDKNFIGGKIIGAGGGGFF